MNVRNAILALSLAFAPAAFAAKAPMFHNSFVKMASQPLVETRTSQAQAETQKVEGVTCDPKGAACYSDDSWTCCSKICIASLCD